MAPFRLPLFRLPVVPFLAPALFFRPPSDFFRPPDVFFLPPADFVFPSAARRLLTVAAAICFARFVLRPAFSSDSLMCSYWRAFFAPDTPRGGMLVSSSPAAIHRTGARPLEARCVLAASRGGVKIALLMAARRVLQAAVASQPSLPT